MSPTPPTGETSPCPPIFNISLLDSHLSSLSATLAFLTRSLDALDSHSDSPFPSRETDNGAKDVDVDVDADWLARELITLKGMAGMLCDGLGRVRRKVVGRGNAGGKRRRRDGEIEGVGGIEDAEGGEGGREAKRRGERLSIEGARPTRPVRAPEDAGATPGPGEAGDDGENEVGDGSGYQVAYIDVTEEVNRRLALTRLRQLSAAPRTSVKRKWSDVVSSPQGERSTGLESGSGRANEGEGEDKDTGVEEERNGVAEGDVEGEGEKDRRKRVKFSGARERFQSRETSSPVGPRPTPPPGRVSAIGGVSGDGHESSSNDVRGDGSSTPKVTTNGGGIGVKRVFRASLDGGNEVGETPEGQSNGGNGNSGGRAGAKRRKI